MLWYVITYPRHRYLFWHASPVKEMVPYKQQVSLAATLVANSSNKESGFCVLSLDIYDDATISIALCKTAVTPVQ